MSDERREIRSMANLLRSGATLTKLSCPACSTPLFRLKNTNLWCTHCKKQVIKVTDDISQNQTWDSTTLGDLESTLTAKIAHINSKIRSTDDFDELSKLSTILSLLLNNLDKTRRLSRLSS